MVRGAWRVLGTEEARGHIAQTLTTVSLSFVLSLISGFAIGVVLHRLPRFRRAIDVATVMALATLLIVLATLISGGLLALNRRLDRSPGPGH
jgi:ABC-type nitrate/sulfonate/bicarbonate transport system permease component